MSGSNGNGATAEFKVRVRNARQAIDVAVGEESRTAEARSIGAGKSHTGDPSFVRRTTMALRRARVRRSA